MTIHIVKNLFIKKMLAYLRSYFGKFASCLILPSKNIRITPNKIRRILIYAQMGIGNMVMFTPLVMALRNYFNNSQIVLLFLRPNGAEQVLAGCDLVDEIIVWDIDKLSFLQKFMAIVKTAQWKPDLIVSRFHSHSGYYILTTLISRAPFRIGHVTSDDYIGKFDYLNNYPVKMGDKEHEIDRYLGLALAIGVPVKNKKPIFYLSELEERYVNKFLHEKGITDRDRFLSLHMTTSHEQRWKQWNIDKWVDLAENLIKQRFKVVILGSDNEREMVLNAFSKSIVKPIIAVGELTLKQTAAVIKNSAVLVCNDSGLMHIGVALDTPVVAIFGPQDYKRVAPLDEKHTLIRKDFPCSPCIITFAGSLKTEVCQTRDCLESIEVSDVLKAVLKYI
jgi:heptosyltransferase II